MHANFKEISDSVLTKKWSTERLKSTPRKGPLRRENELTTRGQVEAGLRGLEEGR